MENEDNELEFRDDYGKLVRLLVDIRGYGAQSNLSLQYKARIIGEDKRFLRLEDIKGNALTNYNFEYKKGKIAKKYIIGVFEEPAEENR